MAASTYPVKWSNLREMFKRVAGYFSTVDDRLTAVEADPFRAPGVLRYRFRRSLSAISTGDFRIDGASYGASTAIRISDDTLDGVDASSLLQQFVVNDYILVATEGEPETLATLKVTGLNLSPAGAGIIVTTFTAREWVTPDDSATVLVQILHQP